VARSEVGRPGGTGSGPAAARRVGAAAVAAIQNAVFLGVGHPLAESTVQRREEVRLLAVAILVLVRFVLDAATLTDAMLLTCQPTDQVGVDLVRLKYF